MARKAARKPGRAKPHRGMAPSSLSGTTKLPRKYDQCFGFVARGINNIIKPPQKGKHGGTVFLNNHYE
jgi:hypothetical protein